MGGCLGVFGRDESGGKVRCFVVVFFCFSTTIERCQTNLRIQSSGFQRKLKSEANTKFLEKSVGQIHSIRIINSHYFPAAKFSQT